MVIPLVTPRAEPVLLQLALPLRPAVPEKLKLIAPFGASAFVTPVATAVKVRVPSKVGVAGKTVRVRVGGAAPTRVDAAGNPANAGSEL